MFPLAMGVLPDPLDVAIQRDREDFIEGMARLGFRLGSDGESLSGTVSIRERKSPRKIQVHLPTGFPFRPPKVRPADGPSNMSWHREREGWLCLYADAETRHLPWRDPSRFLKRVA